MSPAGRMLCLNMIVRNEAAIIGRSLRSAAEHIDYWVIGDTGSTDQTQHLIRSFFAAKKIPGELHDFTFENFAQARNQAMELARRSAGRFDYLLLMDADMELVVEDLDFRRHLQAPAYLARQKATISYWNTRLLRRDVPAHYHGVTHEYLDGSGAGEPIYSVWFADHADGANRAGKLDRDIRLLRDALMREPDNGRSMYYLAQSLRDAGKLAEAAEAYARRTGMGGWDEEIWHAQLELARCRLALSDDAGFLSAAMKAYELRPHRAEPLYELAKFHRLRGANETAMLFCETAAKLPWPADDLLFIEDFVYATGIREEASIAGFYCKSPDRKAVGRRACFELAVDRTIPRSSRDLARHNQTFYARPAQALLPSMQAQRLDFKPAADCNAMNPSIAAWNQTIYLLVRGVNYRISDQGTYITPGNAEITTRNYLIRLNSELKSEAWSEILSPVDMPPPRYSLVRGFEDARLFAWHNALWCSSTVREFNAEGWCEIVLARIDRPLSAACALTDWRVLELEEARRHQKNWMPQITDDTLRFVYSADPTRIVDERGRTVKEAIPFAAFEHARGGSQAIAFDGGSLAIIHEVSHLDERRVYLHRFLSFDAAMTLRSFTEPFYINDPGIEFAAGLAWHPDTRRLIISYGVADGEAWLATVSADDIRAALDHGKRRHPCELAAASQRQP